MLHRTTTNRGHMGLAIILVLSLFVAFHFMFPEVTLWPAALICLAVATMVASHVGGGRHRTRNAAPASIPDERR